MMHYGRDRAGEIAACRTCRESSQVSGPQVQHQECRHRAVHRARTSVAGYIDFRGEHGQDRDLDTGSLHPCELCGPGTVCGISVPPRRPATAPADPTMFGPNAPK